MYVCTALKNEKEIGHRARKTVSSVAKKYMSPELTPFLLH